MNVGNFQTLSSSGPFGLRPEMRLRDFYVPTTVLYYHRNSSTEFMVSCMEIGGPSDDAMKCLHGAGTYFFFCMITVGS